MDALLRLSSAFGLSSAAGLNAYIPLLTVALMARRGMIQLAPGCDLLSSTWCIALLTLLLMIELVVDKIPGIDHINDLVHTAIRPPAAALLFASQAGLIAHGGEGAGHPALWIVLGLICGGAVHVAKTLARPVINVATAGLGAPFVSLVEDLVGAVVTIVSLFVPPLAVLLTGVFAWILWKAFRRRFGKSRPIRVVAVAIESD